VGLYSRLESSLAPFWKSHSPSHSTFENDIH
jgi:hypothetical protein